MKIRTGILVVFASLLAAGCEKPGQGPIVGADPTVTGGDRLFIYQGPYDSLGNVDAIAHIAARSDYAVFTHGFYLDGSAWRNGHCLDVNYGYMSALLARVREINPATRIFVYVPATADHPNGCWPQPSVAMPQCPGGSCVDFKTWTDLWLGMEGVGSGVRIDGIFVDLVHPALIGTSVRDSVYSYVKSKGKLIFANALSDTIGLAFAAGSPYLTNQDMVLIEGYYRIAGYPNMQTDGMNRLLQNVGVRWAALVSEAYGGTIDCTSETRKAAYQMFKEFKGSAFAYQPADLGTQTMDWSSCP